MTDITIAFANHLNARILCSPDIACEIRDEFSYRPNGYQFTPKYKIGLWDGYLRLFSPHIGLLPLGLIYPFMQWAQSKGYTLHIDTHNGKFIERFDIDGFLANQDQWCRFEPYDYQIDAFRNMLVNNRALCLSPTGSGKSLIQFMLCRFLLEHTDYKILLSVPTTQLVEQMVSDFADYEQPTDPFKVSEQCHKVYNGIDPKTDKRVVVSTWQSMFKQSADYLNQFECYICDEAHKADGKSISGMIAKMAQTNILRFGLTGTLNGTKCHEMQLRALFGNIIKTRSTRQLMKDGNLASLDIRCIMYDYQDHAYLKEALSVPKGKNQGTAKYLAEIDAITTYPPRMEAVLNLTMTRSHNTLVLFNFVEGHGKPMFEAAKAIAAKYNREVFYISGETPVEERELIRSKFAGQDNIVLFASYGTFSAGINVKNVHNLILAHPTKSVIRLLQSIGRVLRIADGKTKATLYDIVDDMSRGRKQKNYLYNQFVERLGIYEEQQFDYEIETKVLQ